MTSLVAWVGADSRGPASLNIASDSRISWATGASVRYHWDHGKKIFASTAAPLIVGYTGDVFFPALVLPGAIDRIDRQVFRADGETVEGLISVLRREWRDYPAERHGGAVLCQNHAHGLTCGLTIGARADPFRLLVHGPRVRLAGAPGGQ